MQIAMASVGRSQRSKLCLDKPLTKVMQRTLSVTDGYMRVMETFPHPRHSAAASV